MLNGLRVTNGLRGVAWALFGIVVAVVLAVGAFAVASGSVGTPAAPVHLVPSREPTTPPRPAVSDEPADTPPPLPTATTSDPGTSPRPTASPPESTEHEDQPDGGDQDREDPDEQDGDEQDD